MNADTENTLTTERLTEFRGDVESLKRRNQRFAQMLVEDFEMLIAAAEAWEESKEKVLPHMCRDEHEEIRHKSDDELCPVCRALFAAEHLRAENERLLGFAGSVLRLHRGDGPHDISDVDGGTMQELAVKHGLLEERQVTAPCCDNCLCAENGFPTHCYFVSPLGHRAETVAAGRLVQQEQTERTEAKP